MREIELVGAIAVARTNAAAARRHYEQSHEQERAAWGQVEEAEKQVRAAQQALEEFTRPARDSDGFMTATEPGEDSINR